MNGRFFVKLGRWMKKRLVRIPDKDHYITAWFILSFGVATTVSAIIVALSNPIGTTLISQFLNISKMIIINSLLYPIWIIILAALFSFIYVPLPRLFLASYSYIFISTVVILVVAKSGTLFSIIIGIIYSLIALFIGIILIIFFHKNINKKIKLAILIVILLPATIYIVIDQSEMHQIEMPAIAEHMSPINSDNPAKKGSYDYSFFTYGSGLDIRREEYGIAVDHITPTVDASHLVTRWSNDRESFWGFNQTNLPVNGRVWLPEGSGPFPIILMVHGNHLMENFSTSGYDYLGELLASRGFIAISVDEDFINYSNRYGSPDNNYELRAWMLLQHLGNLQHMNDDPNTPFYQKINFQQTALVGHSRGGQAALMAADYTTFFDEEQLLVNMENVDIQAIVAIAPTDRSVDGKKPSIHNISYLLIHGARDADVSAFRDHPFYRTTFDRDHQGFKTSLYIADANHTHFNSNWGSMDLSFPKGIFLNQKQTLTQNDQQQIAKVYLSAFFETIFHEQSNYEKLFQDYRYGKEWLPVTMFVNKYKNASYEPILTYSKSKVEIIDVDGFTKAEITTPIDRRDNERQIDALELKWEADASYTIDVSDADFSTSNYLTFTMANINENIENNQAPEIDIELKSKDGVSVTLPLNDFMPFPTVISTDYTHFGLFDDIFREGRYKQSWEPIFQTFDIPTRAFEKGNRDFNKENINEITLHFKSSPGAVLLEEIGVW